ncbi:hypothetical protein JCM3770_003797 [Rhodotorula araucariae]
MTQTHHPTVAAALAHAHPHRRFSLDDARAVYALAASHGRLAAKTRQALDIIHQAISTYGLDKVALSFNGGKDCTVLVHLLAAAILRHSHPAAFTSPATPTPSPCTLAPIPTVYVRCPSPFPQVEAFVALSTQWYHLALVAIEGGMRQALQQYLDQHAPSPPKAILVGTRRGDPHGAQLEPLQRTDSGWPDFVRVHPVLDWSYADIWAFLRSDALSLGAGTDGDVAQGAGLGLEWCELYDYGYTSLGSTHNTFPNPLLRATATGLGQGTGAGAGAGAGAGGGAGASDGDGYGHGYDAGCQPLGGWRPAWELEDESAERAGRETSLSAVLARTAPSVSSPSAPTSPTRPAQRGRGGAAGYGDGGAGELDERPIGSTPASRAGSPTPAPAGAGVGR